MANENLTPVFDSLFKFKLNEEVRHKGDTKSYTADMGLLVLQRYLIESEDDDGNRAYERHYVCRMIRFSNSGDLAKFGEKELVSIPEYEERKVEQDGERDMMKLQHRMIEKEILEIFGINREDYLYEIVDGKPDTSKKFRMSGFSTGKILDSESEGVTLLVTESLFTASSRAGVGKEAARDKRQWISKSQFIKVQDYKETN